MKDFNRWALEPHLTPPCSDFACGELKDDWIVNKKATGVTEKRTHLLGHNIYPNLKCFSPSNQAKTKNPGTTSVLKISYPEE